MDYLKKPLCATFDVMLLGELKSFVGWNITRKTDASRWISTVTSRKFSRTTGWRKRTEISTPLPLSADVLPAGKTNGY